MAGISDLLLIGGIGVVGYVYRDEITQFLKDNGILDGGGGGNGGCTKTCSGAHAHLDSDACACVCDTGYIATTNGCVPPGACNGKTCGTGTILNTTTCKCDPISAPCGGKTCGSGTQLN